MVIPDDRYKPIQQVDLPSIEVLVTGFRLGSGHCQDCGKWHQAPLPEGVVPGLLGPGVVALIATLVGEFQLSRQSVSVLLEALLGFQVSPATVSAAEERVSEVLAEPWNEVKTAVQNSDVVNCDETGGRHKGRRSWLWLGATPSLACFLSSSSRGWPAYSQLMSAAFCGLLCTDRWHTYNRHPTNRRQLCWAHLMRDFQKITERGASSGALGTALLDCAKRLFRAWGQFRDGTLSRAEMADKLGPVREDTERLLAEGAAFTDGSTTVKTCENILGLREALWAFIENEGVEPTNNFGERVIRRAVLWRKRSLGTWSQRGEHYLERLLTVVMSNAVLHSEGPVSVRSEATDGAVTIDHQFLLLCCDARTPCGGHSDFHEWRKRSHDLNEERVMARSCDGVMKRDVVAREGGLIVIVARHRLCECYDVLRFGFGARAGCECGGALFDGAANVPDVCDADLRRGDRMLQGCRDRCAIERADARLAPVGDIDQLQRRKRAKGFAHHGAANA